MSAFSSSYRFYFWSLVTLAAIICSYTWMQGAVPQTRNASDSAILFDGAWRAYCGLRPHADFYSSLGPFTYLYVATGFWIFGVSVHVIAYMNVLCFCLLAGGIWYLLRDRLTPFWLFWIALLIATCFIAPWTLRFPQWHSGYGLLYNRHGYTLLMLFCVLLLSPATSISDVRYKLTSIVVGALLPMMFFLKVSVFIAAVPVLVVAYIVEARKWLYALYFSVALAFVTFLFLAYIRFDVTAMMSDLSITARAKSTYVNELFPYFVATAVDIMLPSSVCLIIFSAGVILLRACPEAGFGMRAFIDESLIFLVLLGAGYFIVFTNAIWGKVTDYPCLIMLAALTCARFQYRAGYEESSVRRSNAFRVMLVLAALFTMQYMAVVALFTVSYITPLARPVFFDSPSLRDLVYDNDFSTHLIVLNANDGVKLLKKNGVDTKPFMVMEFTSFIHFALQAKPYAGTPFIDYAINFSSDSHPSPERYIGNAPYVLQAKIPMSPFTLNALKACYGEYISRRYKVLDESERWILLEKIPQ